MLSTAFQSAYNYDPVTVLLVAGVLAVVLSVFPSTFNPFYLLYTIIHELGHGFATMLTGGDFKKFHLSNEPGVAGEAEIVPGTGCNFFIIQAGYLSQAFFTALFIILASMPDLARQSVTIIGAALILLTLIFSYHSARTLAFGIFWGVVFIFAGMQDSPLWSVFILNLLGIYGIIRTFKGITYAHGAGGDAAVMKENFRCSAMFWMFLWGGLSAVCILGSIWVSWFG